MIKGIQVTFGGSFLMVRKEFIVIGDENKEIRDFLERIMTSGSAEVNIGGVEVEVSVRRLKSSAAGKAFLVGGGPDEAA